MSLSASLSFASIGLGLTARRAELVASNVANANRPGYLQRALETGANGRPEVGRSVSPGLVALRREAEAKAGGADVSAAFHARLDAALGDPDEAGSLQDRISALEAALVSATNNPSGAIELGVVARTASDVVDGLRGLDDVVQAERQEADTRIGSQVRQLNADLQEVARLNAEIVRTRSSGGDPASILDRRGLLIDRINEAIPVRELARDHDTVALVAEGGALLLDGRASEIGFTPRAPITAGMDYPTHLSGLTIDGREVPNSGAASPVRGGRLSALFDLRDVVAPEAQGRLDAMAAELIARSADTGADPTLTGAPGLFTEAGSTLDPAGEAGLAGRITLNPLAEPGSPELWRLRDGFGAAAQGSGSDAGNLSRLSGILSAVAAPEMAGLGDGVGSVAGLAGRLKSMVSADRVAASQASEHFSAMAATRREARDGGAVDVDAEMRRLVEIEQAYAANARVVQAVSEMMDRLTGI